MKEPVASGLGRTPLMNKAPRTSMMNVKDGHGTDVTSRGTDENRSNVLPSHLATDEKHRQGMYEVYTRYGITVGEPSDAKLIASKVVFNAFLIPSEEMLGFVEPTQEDLANAFELTLGFLLV